MSELPRVYWIAVLDSDPYEKQELHPLTLQDNNCDRTVVIAVPDIHLLWPIRHHLHEAYKSEKGHMICRIAYLDEDGTLKDALTSCESDTGYEIRFYLTLSDVQDLIDRRAVAWSDKPIPLAVDHNLNPSLALT